MSNLNRLLELAGLMEQSFQVKQLSDYSLTELEEERNSLASQLKGCTILTEHVGVIKYKLNNLENEIKALAEEGISEELKEVDGKWALVSKKSGRPLRYYKGEGKPGDEWVKSQEKSVQYFKNVKEAKSGEEFQDSQPTAASGKDEVGNIFDGHDEESADKEKLDQDRTGITQDRETKLVVPSDVMKQINQRISELKDSMEMYDKTTYVQHYSNKQKAVENLEFIRDKLKMGNVEGFRQAHQMYDSLASIFTNLFPAKLVDFLHDGMASEKTEVAYGDYMKGSPDKPTEGDVVNNALYKPLNTNIYPQKGEDNVPK